MGDRAPKFTLAYEDASEDRIIWRHPNGSPAHVWILEEVDVDIEPALAPVPQASPQRLDGSRQRGKARSLSRNRKGQLPAGKGKHKGGELQSRRERGRSDDSRDTDRSQRRELQS